MLKGTTMEGCLKYIIGIVVIVIALNFIIKIGGCAYDGVKDGVNKATAWRDGRLAKRAREEELKRKQEADAARVAEIKRQQEAKAAAVEQLRLAKADKVRTFALKDAPKVWDVYQALASEIDVQDGKIDELRKTLVAFGRSPEKDEDFNRICAQRDEMIRSQKALYVKLEDAYIAACKFAATPSRKDYNDLQKKAIEDGIKEAESAAAKFKELRLSK